MVGTLPVPDFMVRGTMTFEQHYSLVLSCTMTFETIMYYAPLQSRMMATCNGVQQLARCLRYSRLLQLPLP